MRILDLTLPEPVDNLALDEALLIQAEKGWEGEVLRFWEMPAAAVVLGSGCSLEDDVKEERCCEDGIPIYRRSSGGGTVLLAQGCLCFSLVLSYDRNPALRQISASYQIILKQVCAALACVPGICQEGISDLCVGNRKFSGNAQQRKSTFLLHHGTILYAMDLSHVERYLQLPSRQPDYRQAREHDAFVFNLPLGLEQIKRSLCSTWQAKPATPSWPEETVQELVRDRYSQTEWTRRR